MGLQKASVELRDMETRWPSSVVARERVGDFSGGILSPATMANLDSKGMGPARRLRLGRKIAYPVHELIVWMEARLEVLDRGVLSR